MRQKASTSICHDIKTLSHAFLIIFITHVKICDPLTATARGSFHLCHFSVCICYVMLRNNRRRRDARIAPGRASKENKPFRAQFDAAREPGENKGSNDGRRRRPIIVDKTCRTSPTPTGNNQPYPPHLRACGNHALTGYCHAARCGAIHASRLRRCPTFVNTLYIF